MYLECPFKSWWEARDVFKMPRFSFYMGSLSKCEGVYYNDEENEEYNRKEAEKLLNIYKLKKMLKIMTVSLLLLLFFFFVIGNVFLNCAICIICSYHIIQGVIDIFKLKLMPSKFCKKTRLSYTSKGLVYFVSKHFLKWSKYPITITSHDIGWKTKFDDVRYETPGFFSIIFGRNPDTAYQICMKVSSPKSELEHLNKSTSFRDLIYWEMILSYLYVDKDIEKARKMRSGCWGGSDGNKTPEWDESFVRKKYKIKK